MSQHYQVIIVGGGVTGTALLYTLARYSNVKSIALLEKYAELASLNSKGTSNSQTIHCGDIETNYTLEKARKVRTTANMVVRYCKQHQYTEKFLFSHQKMAIGVGDEECDLITKRFEVFRELYPYLELFDKDKLRQIEPNIILHKDGSSRPENVVGMGVQSGQYTTIDYAALSRSFAENTVKEGKKTDIFCNAQVKEIKQEQGVFHLSTENGQTFTADFVVVDAGAHSLYLAQKMGYGLELSCLPVAGSFYLSRKKILNGKVYMVQNPNLPFAALHGDPDILADGCTRFGPTALALPKLERYHGNKSVWEFLSLKHDLNVLRVVFGLMKESDVRNYILRNVAFEMPYVNKKIFVNDARKIVPGLDVDDIYYAKGFGGIRPQVIDKKAKKMMLGEASIDTDQPIIFNMTPSPGATSCLGNALRDARKVCAALNIELDEGRLVEELIE